MSKSLNYATWGLLVVVACNSNHQLGVGESDSDNTGGKRATRGGSGGAASSTAGVTQVDAGGTSATGGTRNVDATGGTIANGGTADGGTTGADTQGGAAVATGGTASGGAGVATGGMVNTAGNGGRGGSTYLEQAGKAGSAGWCELSLQEVSMFRPTCPATYCEARALERTECASSYRWVTDSNCDDWREVRIVPGAPYIKSCVYHANELVGATLRNDTPPVTGCAAYAVVGGQWSPNCSQWTTATICNNWSTGSAGASGSAGAADIRQLPDANCYNHWAFDCAPCCAATPPDCSDKPDGYPGYKCTVAAGSSGGNSISAYDCDCDCRSGLWSCECGGK